MIINITIFVISLAAVYHACTFAAWLRQKGNNAGAASVYAFVLLVLVLLIIDLFGN